MRYFLFYIAALFVTGCAKPPEFGGINIGMTETEIVSRLGKPDSVAVKGDTKYFEYVSYWGLDRNDYQQWFVRLIDGKVESFGKMGDFDSTKDDTQNININLDQTSAPTTKNRVDLEVELLKYQRLKEQGLISEAEYKTLREKALGL